MARESLLGLAMRFFNRDPQPPTPPSQSTLSALATFDLDRVTGGDDGGDYGLPRLTR